MKAILTYHSIDSTESPISISRQAFGRHVSWLSRGRVRVTTIDELLTLPDAADAVALTFDDGFRNFAEIAAPLLAEHGLPSTVFVVSDHVGRTNAWRRGGDPGIPTLPLLDWNELAGLQSQGVTIGVHTRTHPHLTAMSAAQLDDEIRGAAQICEAQLGRKPAGFAYPYGSISAAAASVVRDTFAWGCTTELRTLLSSDNRAQLPRLDMFYFRDRGRLETWGTTRFDYYLKIRSQARRFRQRWLSGSTA